MADGLRRAYLSVLLPAAALAPIPLYWTGGANPAALIAFEAILLLLGIRARQGKPVSLSTTWLNLLGLAYLGWVAVELTTMPRSFLRIVTHMLLFSAAAKLASLKTSGEAKTALLVIFLLLLASASSSTHVASLIYFGLIAILGFRTLVRIAVLADFDEAPPPRVLRSVPTGGLAVVAIAGACLLGAPLFYALPRLRAPFANAPFRVSDEFSSVLASDRVDLEAFGAAKRSDQVVLRVRIDPSSDRDTIVRLREASFTQYFDGEWRRGDRAPAVPRTGIHLLPAGAEREPASVSFELAHFGSGFLFLPYGATTVELDRTRLASQTSDGVVQISSVQSAVRYVASVRTRLEHVPGDSAIDPNRVTPEIRDYAFQLTSGQTTGRAIADRILQHFLQDGGFHYSLDAPPPVGDPLVHFLLRSKIGHCEYFASAAAMMLAARGIPSRLVTGSYGGEESLFTDAVVVRGGNLHAWVEANLDGSGFVVFDPTPPAGIPPESSRVAFWKRFVSLGQELEFFYDRRILGFDSLDQIRLIDSARDAVGLLSGAASRLEAAAKKIASGSGRGPVIGLLVAVAAFVLLAALARRRRTPPATRAYVALREILARREGKLADSVPPAEVARRLAKVMPGSKADGERIVKVYAASAFGGREPDPAAVRDIEESVKRLRKLA
jgi:hypothetical protein